MRVPDSLRRESLQALPYVAVLALSLGAIVVAGAHFSNAWPSEKAPFGWPGPASFENAVAMVRSDLVLAASIPALVLGARALRGKEPSRDGIASILPTYGLHAALLAIAVAVAAALGAWGAARAPFEAVLAFWTAHTVLALSFYSIAFLWNCYLREHALAAAVATWAVFLGLYESIARTILFRTEGYENLLSGGFPTWFWAAQGFSPLSNYTGILILWRPKFRDFMETEVLKDAVLPTWLTPATFVALAILLWMVVPVTLGCLGWWARGRARVATPQKSPEAAP